MDNSHLPEGRAKVIHRRFANACNATLGLLSVWLMGLKKYIDALNQGMAVIADVSGESVRDLVAMGAGPEIARELLRVHAVYFGATKFTKKQAKARAMAHDLPTIMKIERYAKRVKNQLDAWRLRVELAGTARADIPKVARARLAELRPPRVPDDGVKIRFGKHKAQLVITGSTKRITDIFAGQDGSLDSFEQMLFSGTGRPRATVNVVVHLNELDEIIDGTGDETLIRCTNGAIMTGAQLLEQELTAHGYGVLVHPVKGPVDMGRIERKANFKQRRMCEVENPSCAWPDCNKPAEKCQVHHIKAWKHGGETNIANLLMLCPYHNAVNEDDGLFARGRMTKVLGKSGWISPFGGAPLITHPGYVATALV